MLRVKVRTHQSNITQSDVTFSIKNNATIGELQNFIHKEIGVEAAVQKLYFAGKQLHSAHTLQDYKVNSDDVIQLMLNKASATENKNPEILETKLIEASSKFYKVGDLIDVIYKELGAWFEAKIVNIFTENGKEMWEENLVFEVVMDRNEQTAPIKVTFGEIRPRAHQILEKHELQPEMIVFVNYNIQKPRERGYWYDFHISKRNDKKKNLEGTILLHGFHDDVNCKLKFKGKIMKIEKPTLLTERNMEALKNFEPRKLPLYCKKCKDVDSVNCKDCSCCFCGLKIHFNQLIICDECERTFHLFCLNPPLAKIPSEVEWCVCCT